MANYEKIPGKKIHGLISALIKNRTLIKVAVPDIDYEQLTIVTGAKKGIGGPCFQIDPPDGLAQAIQDNSIKSLFFEFSAEDRLPQRFEAAVKEAATEIWLRYPEIVKRYQLRNDFRIKVPPNAYATLFIAETKVEMVIDNLSLGGIFCHCPNRYKDLVSVGLQCGSIDMAFSYGGQRQIVSADRGVVCRLEGRTMTRHFGVAFEFTHLKANTRRRLTQIVYDLQRDYLRNRSRNKQKGS